MKSLMYSILFLLLTSTFLFSQEEENKIIGLEKYHIYGGSHSDVISNIEFDENGNKYLAGHYSGHFDFFGMQLYSEKSHTYFFCKLDTSDNVVWYQELDTCRSTFTPDTSSVLVDMKIFLGMVFIIAEDPKDPNNPDDDEIWTSFFYTDNGQNTFLNQYGLFKEGRWNDPKVITSDSLLLFYDSHGIVFYNAGKGGSWSLEIDGLQSCKILDNKIYAVGNSDQNCFDKPFSFEDYCLPDRRYFHNYIYEINVEDGTINQSELSRIRASTHFNFVEDSDELILHGTFSWKPFVIGSDTLYLRDTDDPINHDEYVFFQLTDSLELGWRYQFDASGLAYQDAEPEVSYSNGRIVMFHDYINFFRIKGEPTLNKGSDFLLWSFDTSGQTNYLFNTKQIIHDIKIRGDKTYLVGADPWNAVYQEVGQGYNILKEFKTEGNAGTSRAIYSSRKFSNNKYYTTGDYYGQLIIGQDTLSNKGGYVSMSHKEGGPIWAKSFTVPNKIIVGGCEAYENGNVLIWGTYEDSLKFDELTLHSERNFGIYYAAYDVLGELLFANSLSVDYAEGIGSIDIDDEDNAYFAGEFFGNMLYNGQILYKSNSRQTGFMCKISPQGGLDWVKHHDASHDLTSQGLAANAEGVVTMGDFRGETVMIDDDEFINRGKNAIYMISYDKEGGAKWSHTLSGDDMWIKGRSLLADPIGGYVLSGYIDKSTTENATGLYYDDVELESELLTGRSFFIMYLDEEGNPRWYNIHPIEQIDINRSNSRNGELGRKIAMDNRGNIYWSGHFCDGSIRFSDSTYLAAADQSILFIQKLDIFGFEHWTNTACLTNEESELHIFNLRNNFNSLTAFREDEIMVAGYTEAATIKWDNKDIVNLGPQRSLIGFLGEIVQNNTVITSVPIDKSKSTDLMIYPNPTTGIVNVENVNAGTYELINFNGQKVCEYEFIEGSTNRIELHGLAKGTYVLKPKDDSVPAKTILLH